jgi:putative NIF3 family GTP cyclohydrolase 1 type 2
MNFLTSFCIFLATAGLSPDPISNTPLTAYEVVELMKQNLSCSWSEKTVDTFKAGNPENEITGIACTFMATVNVLKHAAAQGCNLVITHEPTYYNHLDSKEKLENDPVYAAKQAIIDEHNLIVFRFHDHWHRTTPDGIYVGMNRKMKWDTYLLEGEKNIFDFPGLKLSDVSTHLKSVFPAANLRVIGDPKLKIKRAAFSAGAPGSDTHFKLLQRGDINLLVIGEAPEWETIEYVRDAVQARLPRSLIILGHTVSEEAGMEYCAEWMRTFIKDVPVFFIPAGDPFHL